MDFTALHPYVYYATEYRFSKGQTSYPRICYTSSLYLISEGKGIISTCGRKHEAASGSLVYIPAGQPHEWIADTQDPMVHICCYFDWAFMDRSSVFENASAICYDFPQLRTTLVGPAFPYPLPEYSRAENLRVWIDWFRRFYTANDYTSERSFMRNLKVQYQFQQFIDFFLTQVLPDDNFPDPRMYKLLDRMEQDMVQGNLKPLEAYYMELKISRGYFFELFKQATGLSPVQYMNNFRISRAKDDLGSADLSITEIAEKHGFSSIHYFSKLFRQLTGLTPREFREKQHTE